MFKSIYASKLYRMSTRKDRINAAFEDPINSELVGQLAKALDEEYQKPEYLVKQSTKDKLKDESEPKVDDMDDGSSESHSTSNSLSGLGAQVSEEIDSGEPSEENTLDDSNENQASTDTANVSNSEESVVEESTRVSGEPVVGSRARSIFKDMRQVADEVKGMLNFKDSTTGVSRILCKENEMWIYYNDDVNLNSVMADVIELLNASGYVYLEFNRLARSDNAIVFLIDFADSHNVIHSSVTDIKK